MSADARDMKIRDSLKREFFRQATTACDSTPELASISCGRRPKLVPFGYKTDASFAIRYVMAVASTNGTSLSSQYAQRAVDPLSYDTHQQLISSCFCSRGAA